MDASYPSDGVESAELDVEAGRQLKLTIYMQTLKGLESDGLNLEFRSDGAGQSADSPADLYLKVRRPRLVSTMKCAPSSLCSGLMHRCLKDLGSDVELQLDGSKLEKNKEYKLSVGQTLKIGSDAVFQARAKIPSYVW